MSHFSVPSFDPIRPTSVGPTFGVAGNARAEILLATTGASARDWLRVHSVSRLVGAVRSVNDRSRKRLPGITKDATIWAGKEMSDGVSHTCSPAQSPFTTPCTRSDQACYYLQSIPDLKIFRTASTSAKFHLKLLIYNNKPCGLMVRIPPYISWGPGVDSRHYQIFLVVVGLERGPLSLVSTSDELLGRNSSDSGLEIRE
jgi:hypothetical protein